MQVGVLVTSCKKCCLLSSDPTKKQKEHALLPTSPTPSSRPSFVDPKLTFPTTGKKQGKSCGNWEAFEIIDSISTLLKIFPRYRSLNRQYNTIVVREQAKGEEIEEPEKEKEGREERGGVDCSEFGGEVGDDERK